MFPVEEKEEISTMSTCILSYIFTIYFYAFLSLSFGNTLNERNMAIELVRTHNTHTHKHTQTRIPKCCDQSIVKFFAVLEVYYHHLF